MLVVNEKFHSLFNHTCLISHNTGMPLCVDETVGREPTRGLVRAASGEPVALGLSSTAVKPSADREPLGKRGLSGVARTRRLALKRDKYRVCSHTGETPQGKGVGIPLKGRILVEKGSSFFQ